ncbi:MAG TPA: hypothetical protein PLM07_16020 [Candidatus Rifleibacterium sp.]|nr:hypothetical protein [Candidatus Rifleibacterium sp.]HPT47389.1 hypothetical protein [Candidatus Rifleibacterium sp.]
MKLLKKQKGLPFLLTLGILFILSASFLAVQLWSDKDSFRGALHALEAPVMPPAMPKVVAPPPVKKVTSKVEVPAEPAPAKVEVAKAVEKKAPAPEPTPVVEAVPAIDKAVLKQEEPPRTVNVKEAAEVAKPSIPTVIKKAKEARVANVAVSETLPAKEKQAVRPRKSRKKAKVEEIPTEIPAEWNWFSKPLKLNLEPGKAKISLADSDHEIKLNESEKIASTPVEVAVQVAKPFVDEVDALEVAPAASSEPIIAEPQTVRPFMMALAKMARIRQMRHAAVSAKAVPAPESLSPSMQRLGAALKAICDRVESSVAPEQTSVESVSEETETIDNSPSEASVASDNVEQAVAEPVSEPVVEPVRPYGGSGSSFSQRVNDLLKSGLMKAD